jgi:hypothetical protein
LAGSMDEESETSDVFDESELSLDDDDADDDDDDLFE